MNFVVGFMSTCSLSDLHKELFITANNQVALSCIILLKFVFISCGKLYADIEDLMNDRVCYRWWTEWRTREPLMEL
ncbi:hypothetical protein NC652_013194 [Populus alba x Populus x berolinensis]|nr:hypothetical protein NC652_013194 [Populus alba x Populus x berolinensis]